MIRMTTYDTYYTYDQESVPSDYLKFILWSSGRIENLNNQYTENGANNNS